jgi:hypothetical protein
MLYALLGTIYFYFQKSVMVIMEHNVVDTELSVNKGKFSQHRKSNASKHHNYRRPIDSPITGGRKIIASPPTGRSGAGSNPSDVIKPLPSSTERWLTFS